MVRRSLFFLLLIAVLAVPVAPALAGSATTSGYEQPAGRAQLDVQSPEPNGSDETPAPARTTKQSTSGNLPFTGLDVGLILLTGLTLLLVGFGMSRLARTQSRSE
jgi:hypothetical protein